MKKINWKILNIAFWLEILLAYLLPFEVADGFKYQAGFPLSFITVYDRAKGVNLFSSMQLYPLAFLANAALIYLIISAVIVSYRRFKGERSSGKI